MDIIAGKRIYLIRHCKAEGQEPQAKLTPEGVEQACKLADFLDTRHIDYIISSPYERAVSTIRPFAERKGLDVSSDDRLCERILSSETLNNWEDELYNSFQDDRRVLPGGESSLEAMERGIAVIQDVCKREEKTIAIVTHGNLMCLMLRHYDPKYGFNEWKSLTNPDVFEFLVGERRNDMRITRICFSRPFPPTKACHPGPESGPPICR